MSPALFLHDLVDFYEGKLYSKFNGLPPMDPLDGKDET